MRSYIVVISPSYGGAEKRFFDIFTSMRRSNADVMLIAPASLVERLMADHPERADIFGALIAVPIGAWSRLAFVKAFAVLLRSLPRGASYHYPLNCLWPLHLGRGDRVSMSVVDCTRVPSPAGGTVASGWMWLSFFFVRTIDVLSPSILAAMRHYRAAPKMTLTPGGTYLVPPAESLAQKAPAVVFIGRLVPGKGVENLLDVLPEVWALLRARAPTGFSFQIAGYGTLEGLVAARAAALAQSGVPVSFIGYAVADALLPSAAIVLSMQDTTNYPSRVVAEALMAGCGVIVRDTGDSRQFGADVPGLLYCAERLDAGELADQMALLLERVLDEPGYQDALRRGARERFSSPAYIDYFLAVAGAA